MGFSSFGMQYWVNPETGKYYTSANTSKIIKATTMRGFETNILYSPTVLATAKKYYGCDSIEGM